MDGIPKLLKQTLAVCYFFITKIIPWVEPNSDSLFLNLKPFTIDDDNNH